MVGAVPRTDWLPAGSPVATSTATCSPGARRPRTAGRWSGQPHPYETTVPRLFAVGDVRCRLGEAGGVRGGRGVGRRLAAAPASRGAQPWLSGRPASGALVAVAPRRAAARSRAAAVPAGDRRDVGAPPLALLAGARHRGAVRAARLGDRGGGGAARRRPGAVRVAGVPVLRGLPRAARTGHARRAAGGPEPGLRGRDAGGPHDRQRARRLVHRRRPRPSRRVGGAARHAGCGWACWR